MGESTHVVQAMEALLSTASLRLPASREFGGGDFVTVRSVWSGGEASESGAEAERSAEGTAPQGRIHHLEAGSGPPLVLLHGGTGGGANWFRLIAPLAAHFRVLAPDLPGFGLSDPISVKPPLGQTAATRILEWLQAHDLDDVLVAGTSFGGLVALRLAQRTARVTRLLLLDSAGLGRGIHPAMRLIGALPGTRVVLEPTRRGTAAAIRHLLTANVADVPAMQLHALEDYLFACARLTGADYAAAALQHFAGLGGQREVLAAEELARIRQPVSLVWGARDRLLPTAHAHSAARSLPDVVLRIVPDVGHSPNWEAPLQVVDAIAELASRRAHALPERARD